MSGSTIGGIVGGVIGFYFGGPAGAQWGFMIGSAVGGYVDPEKIYGPRLSDAREQTAHDGVPRAYGYGRFPCSGNIIWRDILNEVEEEDDGKGGPVQITYRYTRSYAIGICKGPISGFLLIKRNGKIVFDARTDAELTTAGYTGDQIKETRAAQAKFTQICTFYYGDQAGPDPTIVAVKGAGNVPNYTGTAYIVMTNDDVTELSGAIPQFEFVVAECGERHDDHQLPSVLLISGDFISTDGPVVAVAEATETPSFTGVAQSTGADLSDCIPGYYDGVWCLVSEQECRYHVGNDFDDWQSSTIPFDPSFYAITLTGGPAGWVVSASGPSFTQGIMTAPMTPTVFTEYNPSIIQDGLPYGSMMESVAASVYLDKYYFDCVLSTSGNVCTTPSLAPEVDLAWEVIDNEVLRPFHDLAIYNGSLYAASKKQFSTGRQQLVYSLTGGTTWEDPLIDIEGNVTETYQPYQLASGTNVNGDEVLIVLCWGAEYIWTSEDNFAEPRATGIATNRGPDMSAEHRGKQIVFANGRFYIVSGTHGDPAKADKCVVTVDGLTFSAPITLPIQQVRGIAVSTPSADSELTPIPDAPGYYINELTGEITGPPGTTIDPCQTTLGEIVSDQCNRRGVSTIDVSELTDIVTGYRIASTSSSKANIGGLMPAYFFSSSQFDGVLHFPKMGRDNSFSIGPDDFVAREGDAIQWERIQESELLRKLTVGYLDPETTYTPTTQEWSRRAGTVKAQGESTLEIPVVGDRDWAAQVADKTGRIAWSESDSCTFHLSREWARLVVGAEGLVTDEKGVIHRVRITKIQDDGGIRMVDARRTSRYAYESVAQGVQKPLPLFPGSDMRGPTQFAVMNMAAILDTDDRPGLYWAANGIMSGWSGARLQILRAGVWTTLGDITSPSVVGTLADDLPGHAGDLDTANVLRVNLDSTLANVTFAQLLTERNPVAIIRPDNTVEVVQFQFAELDSDGIWSCTYLIRGNLDTDSSAHLAGATVVLLTGGFQFVDLRPDDAGTTQTFRVFSLGTDPDTATPFNITFVYVWSSTEWPVAYLDVVKDGDDFTLTWLERRRLGTDVDPIRSSNWDGYSVRYDHAGGTGQVTVTDPTHTFTLPGATDVDFYVAQINRLTGRGPETMVNHE